MAQQEDYFYEIQLTNKQLVFYFMAGATVLILGFLAGVMVGRGVDAGGGEVQASRPAQQEEKVVTEETLKPPAPPAEELSYAQRLESEKPEEGLEKPKPAAESPRPAARTASTQAAERPAPAAVSPPVRSPAAAPSPAAAVSSRTAPAAVPASKTPASGSFTIQVGAFKDRASAESVSTRLKGKGFSAYVVAPPSPDGLYNVRVGSYGARADAERVQAKLRDEEKFKPFIVKN